MANSTYKQDLHDISLAVANNCKNYIDKSIDNLKWELGTYDLGIESDNTSALVKTMPSGTIKANVNKIYGASEVSENLIVLTDSTLFNNGIDCVITNQIPNVSGTATNTAYITMANMTLSAGTYYFKSFGSSLGGNNTYFTCIQRPSDLEVLSRSYYNGTITLTETTNLSYLLVVRSGVAISTPIQFKDMLVKGSTAPTTFKVSYTGIHNLELSGLKVEGENILNPSDLGTDVSFSNDICSITNSSSGMIILKEITLPAGTYVFSFINYTQLTSDHTFSLYINKVGTVFFTNFQNFTLNQVYTSSITLSQTSNIIIQHWQSGSETYSFKLWLNRNTAMEYVPYVSQTLPIDLTSILYNGSPLFEGNSLKAVNDVKDILTPYKATKKLGYVDLGALVYRKISTADSDLKRFGADVNGIKPSTNNNTIANILCAKYNTTYSNATYNNTIGIAVDKDGVLFIYDSVLSSLTPEEFAVAMSGVYLVYELATPIEADIDFSQLKNIQGYSNGSITAQNTYDMAVHSEIDYLVEEVKA